MQAPSALAYQGTRGSRIANATATTSCLSLRARALHAVIGDHVGMIRRDQRVLIEIKADPAELRQSGCAWPDHGEWPIVAEPRHPFAPRGNSVPSGFKWAQRQDRRRSD